MVVSYRESSYASTIPNSKMIAVIPKRELAFDIDAAPGSLDPRVLFIYATMDPTLRLDEARRVSIHLVTQCKKITAFSDKTHFFCVILC